MRLRTSSFPSLDIKTLPVVWSIFTHFVRKTTSICDFYHTTPTNKTIPPGQLPWLVTEEPRRNDMLIWPKSFIGTNKTVVEPSLISKLKRVVSPLKRYVAAGGLSDDAPTVRHKAPLKCPVMLSPWRAKKLWKIILTKSRFVQSFALPVEGEERPTVCSPVALDLFPLKALVSGWEPFIKNLFAVARFKDLPKMMWDQDDPNDCSSRCGRSRDGSRDEISRSRRSSRESRRKGVRGSSLSLCSRNSSLDCAKSRTASPSQGIKCRGRPRSESTNVSVSPRTEIVSCPRKIICRRYRRPYRKSTSLCRRPVCSMPCGIRIHKPRTLIKMRRKYRSRCTAPRRGRKRR
ncbi:hypothetical protein Btru_042534 [Bulinus truncatus]|nr:hypothetical protein Btru_042534 [Bulinus truncatus]